MGSTSEKERATRAAGVRMSVGGLLLLAPGLGRILFGIPKGQDNAAVRLLARLFGIRNIILGGWALAAQEQDAASRRACYQLNAAVDAVDVVALAIAAVTGDGLVRAAVMGSVLGTGELLAWLDLAGDSSTEVPQGSVALT
ncbi:MAG: hypothetical protein QOK05_2867 [Chloroflexota bacterium]|jgi:hypothetical protein|nr:hypothetical protein [Chloroflexota bacterium]